MDLLVCKNGNKKFLVKIIGPDEVNSSFSFWDVRELLRSLPDVEFYRNVRPKVPHYNIQWEGKSFLKLYPGEGHRYWTIHVYDCSYFTRICDPQDIQGPTSHLMRLRLRPQQDTVSYSPNGKMERTPYLSPAFIKLAKYLMHYQKSAVDESLWAFLSCCLTPKALQRSLRATHDLIGMLAELPGTKVLYINRSPEPAPDNVVVIPELGRVQGIVWVAPWAEKALLAGTHQQVDASFKVVRPYVYYIPTAVIQNAGLACGFSIAPTERSTLYERYESQLAMRIFTPVLSDMSKAIGKFCEDRQLRQFYCHRHLLESLGSNSIAANLFRPLLEAFTFEGINALMPQFVSDVVAFRNAGLIRDDGLRRIEKYCGISFRRADDGQLLRDYIVNNVEAINKWAIAARGGASRCSNHAEVTHRHGNAAFETRVRVLVQLVKDNIDTYNDRLDRQIREHQNKLRKKICDGHCCEQNLDCHCEENERNKLMFQCEGFCIHTCMVKNVETNDCLRLRDEDLVCPRRPVKFIIEDEVWEPDGSSRREPSSVRPKQSGKVAGNVVEQLIRSLARLIGRSKEETAAKVVEYAVMANVNLKELWNGNVELISLVKLNICHLFHPEWEISKIDTF